VGLSGSQKKHTSSFSSNSSNGSSSRSMGMAKMVSFADNISSKEPYETKKGTGMGKFQQIPMKTAPKGFGALKSALRSKMGGLGVY
jgi:hypothetical protein